MLICADLYVVVTHVLRARARARARAGAKARARARERERRREERKRGRERERAKQVKQLICTWVLLSRRKARYRSGNLGKNMVQINITADLRSRFYSKKPSTDHGRTGGESCKER